MRGNSKINIKINFVAPKGQFVLQPERNKCVLWTASLVMWLSDGWTRLRLAFLLIIVKAIT